jgi:ribosomal protein S18 acetylase RimI-like enzyme
MGKTTGKPDLNSRPDSQLRDLEKNGLEHVARIHKLAFPESALTKLGTEAVRRYYEWQLNGPHDCYAIGIFDREDNLVGFCFAGVFRGSLSGYLEKNKVFLLLWLVFHPWLVFNPLIMERIQLALRLFTRKRTPKSNLSIKEKENYGVLSIAVDPKKQGLGIGKKLMNLVEQDATKKGFFHLLLTVHITNTQAIKFYENLGWKKTNIESKNWNGEMVKDLFSNNL